ncbi:chloramphenicol phosphotransferase [Rhizobium sp.]|jgi:chloramphenicol 3-O phosphotransferase|uniref:chloramphenicol phosphotransferase CPT family protein n=1 Tax=Rhizobium sp. TaxID=391 RepID=UPI000E8FC929|nr:chloramphenicol phosphotransferase [Rhizobium sp.]
MESVQASPCGLILILNGAPRSGKSSLAKVIVERFPGLWVNMGVDAQMGMISSHHAPGIGLRPGGEHPEKEEIVKRLYAALYESIAAHSRLGVNIVVDVGHHDGYSKPLNILDDCAQRLAGLPAFFIGIRCSLAAIMVRRKQLQTNIGTNYLQGSDQDPVPLPVQRWQEAVHDHGAYDLEIDTTNTPSEDCAATILAFLNTISEQPTFFERRLKSLENTLPM